jgi:hypothetical protein
MLDHHQLQPRAILFRELLDDRAERQEGVPGSRMKMVGQHRLEIGEQHPNGNTAAYGMADEVRPALQTGRLSLVRAEPRLRVEDAEGKPDAGPGIQHQPLERREHVGRFDQRRHSAIVARRRRHRPVGRRVQTAQCGLAVEEGRLRRQLG